MKHIWFAEWVKAYDCRDSLAVVTIWSDGQLVAAAPVRRVPFRFRGVKSKGLSFLYSEVTPRCNLIVADDDYVQPLMEQVLGLPDWDILYMKNLEAEVETTKRLMTFLRERRFGAGIQEEEGLQSPYLLTEGSFENYWSSFPKKRRKHLDRMCIKRLEKAEDHEVSQITTSGQFEQFIPTMFEISRKSWKSATDDHLKADSAEGRLYIGFTPIGIDRGLVTLYTIKVNGKVIGFEYLLSCKHRYSLIRCDYDEEFKYYSPGSNLRLAILKDLFDKNHICEYDLGGDAYSYKLEWCDSIRNHIKLWIGNNSLRGRAIMLSKNIVLPILRKAGLGNRRLGNSE